MSLDFARLDQPATCRCCPQSRRSAWRPSHLPALGAQSPARLWQARLPHDDKPSERLFQALCLVPRSLDAGVVGTAPRKGVAVGWAAQGLAVVLTWPCSPRCQRRRAAALTGGPPVGLEWRLLVLAHVSLISSGIGFPVLGIWVLDALCVFPPPICLALVSGQGLRVSSGHAGSSVLASPHGAADESTFLTAAPLCSSVFLARCACFCLINSSTRIMVLPLLPLKLIQFVFHI